MLPFLGYIFLSRGNSSIFVLSDHLWGLNSDPGICSCCDIRKNTPKSYGMELIASLGVILYWQRFATTVWWLWHCGALLRWAEEVEEIRTRNNLWKLTQHWTAAGNCSSMKGHLKLRECVAQKKVEDRNSPHSWARRVLKRSYWDSCHWETSDLQHRHTQGLQINVTSMRF